MQEKNFFNWLSRQGIATNTIQSRISNLRTIESAYGDIDNSFDIDGCEALANSLVYTKNDERDNRPAKHKIHINGNIYNGTATLRASLNLYVSFRTGNKTDITQDGQILANAKVTVNKKDDWPVWEQPDLDSILQLAKATTRYVRFLKPEIIEKIVKDNEKNRPLFEDVLVKRGIDVDLYLWNDSPCAFPGVRRYSGNAEKVDFRKRADAADAIALDDNDYPKQIWSFLFLNRKFPKNGPKGYSLAHIFDHKKSERFREELIVPEDKYEKPLYGLYTCASNTVYVPNGLMKPTDFNGPLRNLLFNRAFDLYKDVCNVLPKDIKIPAPFDADWNFSNFDWASPVGESDSIDNFLRFRLEFIKSFSC